MLKRRIIPCLDIQNGRTVKGINFIDIQDAGDPIELAKSYVKQGADELVFLDITATKEDRKTFAKLADQISKNINIPFTVGGGIKTVKDVDILLKSGADKVSINSYAVKNPDFINESTTDIDINAIINNNTIYKNSINNNASIQDNLIKRFKYNKILNMNNTIRIKNTIYNSVE